MSIVTFIFEMSEEIAKEFVDAIEHKNQTKSKLSLAETIKNEFIEHSSTFTKKVIKNG